MTEAAAWAILFLPLASFLFIALVIRPFLNHHAGLSGYVTILAIGAAFVLSLVALAEVASGKGEIGWAGHSWLVIGSLDITVGILMDPLTAIMLVVVSGVSLAVQIYSQGYMRGDSGYSRYFAFMSLFTASMLGLVLSRNIIQVYVFWELVGLSSYLLIGFWSNRPSAAAAAKKAFLVTRLGDVGFMLAILYLFFNREAFLSQGLNPFEIGHINLLAQGGELAGAQLVAMGSGVATWVALGIFAGAVGKSAQFPLHVWLPDAMEGPTPVSALIHAATMVVAGVFLVARFFPLFEASTTAMGVVAAIGAFTAFFAATMGLVMYDIKRVLAYSTVSQLGYMMLALGVGAYEAAIFHLFNHAFFKALLFLGSGSVNHATGTFDMRYMGGLRRRMPLTYITFLIASLSICGLFPLAGFWSKDEILVAAWNFGGALGQIVFYLALVTAFMTAFYIFRALFMTFHGEFQGGVEAEHAEHGGQNGGGHGVHLAESPMVMVAPMAVLAVLSIVSGFLANPLNAAWGLGVIPAHWFVDFLDHVELVSLHAAKFNLLMAAAGTAVALAGIGLAYLMYYRRSVDPDDIAAGMGPGYTAAVHKYYFDNLYEDVVTRGLFYRGLALATDWIDRNIVDMAGTVIAWFGRNLGRAVAKLETGQVQAYGAGISAGLVLIVVAFVVWS